MDADSGRVTELSVVEEARQRAEDGCDTFTAFATAINEEQIPSYEELRLAAQSVKAAVGALSVAVRRVETLEAALKDVGVLTARWQRAAQTAEQMSWASLYRADVRRILARIPAAASVSVREEQQ